MQYFTFIRYPIYLCYELKIKISKITYIFVNRFTKGGYVYFFILYILYNKTKKCFKMLGFKDFKRYYT